MEFSRQEYWSGLPFPSPADLPDQGLNLGLQHCRHILYYLSHQGTPSFGVVYFPIIEAHVHIIWYNSDLETLNHEKDIPLHFTESLYMVCFASFLMQILVILNVWEIRENELTKCTEWKKRRGQLLSQSESCSPGFPVLSLLGHGKTSLSCLFKVRCGQGTYSGHWNLSESLKNLCVIRQHWRPLFMQHSEWPCAAAAAAKSVQSCPTLCNPIDGSPPGSPVPGILQARTLEWVAISFSNAWKWKVKVKPLSYVRPSATPWTAAFQAPPSIGFSRQEYWSGEPLPSPVAMR